MSEVATNYGAPDVVPTTVASSPTESNTVEATQDGAAFFCSGVNVGLDSDVGVEGQNNSSNQARSMTLLEHLTELRVRIIRCFIALLIGMVVCYGYAPKLFTILQQPLRIVLPEQSTFIFTSLTEAFFVYMKVSLVASLFLTSPYLFYQFWRFISPGLYSEERRLFISIAICSAFFFTSGAFFGYYVVFPLAFSFFMGFATDIIKPMPSLDLYLNFCLKMLFAFGFVFELPLFIFFLVRLGLVTTKQLKQMRNYCIVIAFIVAALLTPGPDVMSQLLMAFPLIFLYEVGIIVAIFFGKKQATTDVKKDPCVG